MANDRIFIVCEWCGSIRCVAKYYPRGTIALDGDDVAEFTKEHSSCVPETSDLELMPLSLINEGIFKDRHDETSIEPGAFGPSRVRVAVAYKLHKDAIT